MIRVCRADELSEGECREFSLHRGEEAIAGFVVRRGENLYAYHNRCPHTGATLNWNPDQFLSVEGTFIQCALHGALFAIDSGSCLQGPCNGQGLNPLQVIVEQGVIHITET